jgi:signal transduction histidine kinase
VPGATLFHRLRSPLFDLLVAAGVAGLTGLGVLMRTTPRASVLPGLVMAVAVLVRRRWPLWTMGAVAAAALSQVLLFAPANDPLPYDAAVLVAMYSTVKYGRRRLDGYLAGAVVAAGIVIEVVRHTNPRTWWPVLLTYVGLCGGVWLMAYTVRVRRIYVAGLEERAATLERERDHLARIAVADERAAIARELHDVVAHSLAVMIVQADGGRYAFDTDPGQAREALVTVAATGREALEDMRRLVGVLRGTGSDSAAEPEADDRRRASLRGLDTLVERACSAGLSIVVNRSDPPPELPPAAELTVYRIVQEALTNVLRHAGRRARVTLSVAAEADTVKLSIVDDGGDRLAPVGGRGEGTRTAGNGLVGMRERIAVHGGTFRAGPRLDGGWAVEATIPTVEAA